MTRMCWFLSKSDECNLKPRVTKLVSAKSFENAKVIENCLEAVTIVVNAMGQYLNRFDSGSGSNNIKF